MNDPGRLRAHAANMYALARRIRDDEPLYANYLIERVEELQAQATAVEEAAKFPRAADAPQQPPQLQEQIQPKQDEE